MEGWTNLLVVDMSDRKNLRITSERIEAPAKLSMKAEPVQDAKKAMKAMKDNMIEVNKNIEIFFQSSKSVTVGKLAATAIDRANITMTISINQADLTTVQKFFRDLTERAGIGQFDFTLVTDEDESERFIHCDGVTAHYHIVEQLLKFSNYEPRQETKCIIDYALTYLPGHLKMMKDELKLPERKAISRRLMDLLSDIKGIGKHLGTNNSMGLVWINEERKTIESWLTDSMDVLEPKEKRWVILHTEPEGKCEFYKPLTLMIGRRWLQHRSWNAYNTYLWIQKFIELVS